MSAAKEREPVYFDMETSEQIVGILSELSQMKALLVELIAKTGALADNEAGPAT